MVLLHLMSRLLVNIGLGSCNGEALSDLHIGLGLCEQRVTNILFATRGPAVEALVAEGPDGHISFAGHEVGSNGRRLGGDAIDVHFELLAEGLERQVVHIVAEGVLDFTADGGQTQDDVCGEDGSGDRDPLQRSEELEGQNHDVHPSDLGNGDRVGDR